MQQLFKGVYRTTSQMMRQQFAMPMASQMRVFTTRSGPVPGAETSITDVADVFKVNYTVEFDQGLTDE
jgi:succinate dehydrogenase (ubiquinone) iron-sulfur subunit